MSHPEVVEAIPVPEPKAEQWERAARFLEQAVSVGCKKPETLYLLALCYKRQGKFPEARQNLRKIPAPDANVLLQLGLISFAERQFAQAEDEFARSCEKDPRSYAACFNLLLARLYQGKFADCLPVMSRLLALAPTPEESHFLSLLMALLQRSAGTPPQDGQRPGELAALQDQLQSLSPAEEQRLVLLLQNLGSIESAFQLLRTLAAARPASFAVQEAHLEVALVQVRRLMDRCDWRQADDLLRPLCRLLDNPLSPLEAVPEEIKTALLNLQGCCASMLQDFDRAAHCFSLALRLTGRDPWLHQNLALAHELNNKLDQADTHWNRYFDLVDGRLPPAPVPSYSESVAFEGLCRLSDLFARHERWNTALAFLNRAQKLRSRDVDLLERLFHLQIQIKRPEDGRKTLRRLRELRPEDPRFDLYELDLRELRSIDDVDKMFGDIKRIMGRHPNDLRIEERALSMVASFIPLIQRRCEQLVHRVDDIDAQVRRLHDYQINWPVVHDEMHELRLELQKLRRICNKCLSLVASEDLRMLIRDLNAQIDRRIDQCLALGG